MKKIKIYTDGSCLGNPGPGGWAYILCFKGCEKVGFGGEANSTNNKMELRAIIEALKALKEPCEVELYTDSKLMMQAINDWLEGWVKKDFKGKANVDLWKEYLKCSKDHIIKAFHVRAHKGHEFNERCDEYARKAAGKVKLEKKDFTHKEELLPCKKEELKSTSLKPCEFDPLYEALDYRFQNKEALIQALTHKSSKQKPNNERLEFLGDAVFDLVVGEYLFFLYPCCDEGELSKLRASLVSEKSLAKMARDIDLGRYIYLSLAEEHNDGKNKPSILSDALEATLGAIFLEAGFEEAKKSSLFVLRNSYEGVDFWDLLSDYKTKLQEITQSRMGKTPSYEFISSFGPDHKKEFKMAVLVGGEELASGQASTKKQAEQIAAKKAIQILENS